MWRHVLAPILNDLAKSSTNNASCETDGDSLHVTTPIEQWAYTVDLPLNEGGPILKVEMSFNARARIYEGEIGLGLRALLAQTAKESSATFRMAAFGVQWDGGLRLAPRSRGRLDSITGCWALKPNHSTLTGCCVISEKMKSAKITLSQ